MNIVIKLAEWISSWRNDARKTAEELELERTAIHDEAADAVARIEQLLAKSAGGFKFPPQTQGETQGQGDGQQVPKPPEGIQPGESQGEGSGSKAPPEQVPPASAQGQVAPLSPEEQADLDWLDEALPAAPRPLPPLPPDEEEPAENRFKKVRVIVILAVLAGLGGWWGYRTISRNRKETAQRKLRHEEMSAKIASFANHYNAITSWGDELLKEDQKLFSLRVEEAIINTGGRPILITEPIDDVVREGDKFFIYVHGPESTFRFILDCDREVASRINADKTDPDHYAIIARISSVKKADLKLKSVPADDPQDVDPLIEAEYSDQFFARGRFIDSISTKEE